MSPEGPINNWGMLDGSEDDLRIAAVDILEPLHGGEGLGDFKVIAVILEQESSSWGIGCIRFLCVSFFGAWSTVVPVP